MAWRAWRQLIIDSVTVYDIQNFYVHDSFHRASRDAPGRVQRLSTRVYMFMFIMEYCQEANSERTNEPGRNWMLKHRHGLWKGRPSSISTVTSMSSTSLPQGEIWKIRATSAKPSHISPGGNRVPSGHLLTSVFLVSPPLLPVRPHVLTARILFPVHVFPDVFPELPPLQVPPLLPHPAPSDPRGRAERSASVEYAPRGGLGGRRERGP